MKKKLNLTRTCTLLSEHSSKQIITKLEDNRHLPAYVLLGDPGAGKTFSFLKEAEETKNGVYIKARDFSSISSVHNTTNETTYFIDGLDELRAGDGDSRTPLDHIKVELQKLGNPKFRLSCREADWLGSSDSEALTRISPDGVINVLHLNPLTTNDIKEFLLHYEIHNPEKFIEKAESLSLDELLTNPQTLILLIEAVQSNNWPASRKEVYEMACLELIKETNTEHRHAKRNSSYPNIDILDTAGYLSSVQLLSGATGYALDVEQANTQYIELSTLQFSNRSLLSKTLKTRLFKSGGIERLIPIHRSVAEYLGGRYIANLIDIDGLPVERVLSLMCGFDGGLVTDLRGLAAWLSVHSTQAREALIQRDPLGIILYGDITHYSITDKKYLLKILQKEVEKNPWLRSGEWISHPFGGLATKDMKEPLVKLLSTIKSNDADQSLLGCILDAIEYGNIEFEAQLIESLVKILLTSEFWPINRKLSFSLLLKEINNNSTLILKLISKITTGEIEDRDDELLGLALRDLYPKYINSLTVFDYLHSPKDRNLIGNYLTFWLSDLTENSKYNDIKILLDQLVLKKQEFESILSDYQINEMCGKLLIQGLNLFGSEISKEKLYEWLGVGLDQHSHSRLDRASSEVIGQWFSEHPQKYKDVVKAWADLCLSGLDNPLNFYKLLNRLYNAKPPKDIDEWFLTQAITYETSEISHQFFHQALIASSDYGNFKADKLEFYEKFVEKHPKYLPWLEERTVCDIPDWRKDDAKLNNNWKKEQDAKKNEHIVFLKKHIDEITNGSASPHVLHNLALAYGGLLIEAHGDDPLKRLENFLNHDFELIDAALSGLKNSIYRKDLPEVAEILDLNKQGRMHYIRSACLIGIKILFQEDPSILNGLSESILAKLIAFKLTYDVGSDLNWFTSLCEVYPKLVAKILEEYAVPLIKSGQEHISSLYPLAHNESYSKVALLCVPKLLKALPLRVKKTVINNSVEPLLTAAMFYLPPEELKSIVKSKLSQKSMDNAQRTYWYGCALLLEPKIYEKEVNEFIGTSQTRSTYLVRFLYIRHKNKGFYENLPISTLGMLIKVLGPGLNSRQPEGSHWISPLHEKADLVRSLIGILSNHIDIDASVELKKLSELPQLDQWNYLLTRALHAQKIVRRKATFQHIAIDKIVYTLMNKQPSSAADLWALALNQITDIANSLRNGSLDGYQHFWNTDSKGNVTDNAPENICRNRLLWLLKERLSKFKIDAEPEGNYAEQKRADIRLSYGGFNIPIEIKLDKHRDLWKAINDQLVAKYIRDPGSDGYGIFIVIWLGGKDSPLPPDGKRPLSALELQGRLINSLDEDIKHRVGVCVIDSEPISKK